MLWALGRLGAEEACRSSAEFFFRAQRVELAEVAARQVAGPEFLDARRGASPVELLASVASSGEALLSAGVASSWARAPVLADKQLVCSIRLL